MTNALLRLARSILLVLLPLLAGALLVAAAFGWPPAYGQQRHAARMTEPVLEIDLPAYSAQVAAERRELLRILGRTRICMFDATAAMRSELQRAKPLPADRAEVRVRGFVKEMCSGQIRPFLVRVSRWSEADADAFVDELVDELVEREVQAATSWGTP